MATRSLSEIPQAFMDALGALIPDSVGAAGRGLIEEIQSPADEPSFTSQLEQKAYQMYPPSVPSFVTKAMGAPIESSPPTGTVTPTSTPVDMENMRTMEAIQALKDADARRANREAQAKDFRQRLREAVSEGANVFTVRGDNLESSGRSEFAGKTAQSVNAEDVKRMRSKPGSYTKMAKGTSERAMMNMDPIVSYLVEMRGYSPNQAYLTSRMLRSGAQQDIMAETGAGQGMPDGRTLSGIAQLAELGDLNDPEFRQGISQYVRAMMNATRGR